MATNPLVKIKRGAYSNLTNYPSIDGQLFFASNSAASLVGTAASDTEGYNVIVFDIQDGNSVIRRNVDAYRAIYAQTAGTAGTANQLGSSVSFSISDGNGHSGNTVSFNGTQNVALTLPTTIQATLSGRATSATKLVGSSSPYSDVGVGSNVLPVYFSAGVPVACAAKDTGNPLTIDISGNAATATYAANLDNLGAGSTILPVYFASGVPVAVTNLDATKLTGTIPLECIPAAAKERLHMAADQATMLGLSSSTIQEGDVVKNGTNNELYYVVSSSATIDTDAGDLAGTHFKFVHFSAGSSASADYAATAGKITGATIALSGGVTGTATTFTGESAISIPVTTVCVSGSGITISGTLAVNHGGTGKISWNKGRIVVSSTDTTPVLTELGSGTDGQLLSSKGSDALPVWVNRSAVSVGEASKITGAAINGTNFTGEQAITTAKWGNARTVTISDNDGSNTLANDATHGANNVIDGSANFTLKLPATIKASLSGNATTATTASALAHTLTVNAQNIAGGTAKTITYGGTASQNSELTFGPDDLFTVYKTDNATGATTKGTWSAITTPSGMPTGTYIVQIHAKAATGSQFNEEYFSGVMSYSSADGASTTGDSDEVLLHACGKSLGEHHIYLRTRRQNGSNQKVIIEMCADVNLDTSKDKFDFKFRRML